MERLEIYYKLLWIYYEYILQILESDTKNRIREWNILLDKIKDIVLQFYGFTAYLEEI